MNQKLQSALTADVPIFTFMAITTAISFVPEKIMESDVSS